LRKEKQVPIQERVDYVKYYCRYFIPDMKTA